MRDLAHRYLTRGLSRREFLTGLRNAGYSLAAAAAIADSLAPLEAGAKDRDPAGSTLVEGTGAHLLVEQARAAGVEFVFNCNASGTSAIFDALVDRTDLRIIQVPQEGQMISVAEGYGLVSGRTPLTVSGGVGLPNTLSNLYNAWKDRSPLVSVSQREPTSVQGGRDAFQEWDDYLAPSASFTRWRWSVHRQDRIPEFVRRAFRFAATPPAGPVTLAFPTDVLTRPTRAAILDRARFLDAPRLSPDAGAVEEAARLLVESENPILIVGAEVTRSSARAAVVELAEQLGLPVAQGDPLFDDFPTAHPLFVGSYRGASPDPRPIDLIVCLGSRMPGSRGGVPRGARVVHVSADPAEIGRATPVDVAIVADAADTAIDLLAAVRACITEERLRSIRSERGATTRRWTETLRARRDREARRRWDDEPISWDRVGGELARVLAADAIVVPELAEESWLGLPGNAALGRIDFAPGGRSRIGRTIGSALGWGVGAAIGVQLACPDRQVVALQGDGGFLFSQAEALWTMSRYEVPVIVVVFNNRSYNGPRNKVFRTGGRQRESGRDMTCYLGDPDVDFAAVASGFGVAGEVVRRPGEVGAALRRAIAKSREGKPYLLDVEVARTGLAADSTWYPRYSVAAARKNR